MSAFANLKFYLGISILLIWLCLKNAQGANISTYIVNGTSTTIASNQYLVSLLTNSGSSLVCGGGLIKPQHVITAAHCVIGFLPRNFTVRGGSSFYNQGGVLRQVIRIARPSIYNNVTYDMDVAALKLRLPMSGPNITTIPLCSSILYVGNITKVSGWGQISETNTTSPLQLRTVNLPIISNSLCKARYATVPSTVITNNQFCASDMVVRGACYGDSGAPLVFNGQLCGVTSYGMDCDKADPNVFTRVNSRQVRNFIMQQTSDTI